VSIASTGYATVRSSPAGTPPAAPTILRRSVSTNHRVDHGHARTPRHRHRRSRPTPGGRTTSSPPSHRVGRRCLAYQMNRSPLIGSGAPRRDQLNRSNNKRSAILGHRAPPHAPAETTTEDEIFSTSRTPLAASHADTPAFETRTFSNLTIKATSPACHDNGCGYALNGKSATPRSFVNRLGCMSAGGRRRTTSVIGRGRRDAVIARYQTHRPTMRGRPRSRTAPAVAHFRITCRSTLWSTIYRWQEQPGVGHRIPGRKSP